MKILSFLLLPPLLALSFSCLAQGSHAVLPTTEQVKWANAEIGVMIDLDLNIFAPDTYQLGKRETLPPLSVFHPSRLNTDQWLAAAKLAGAKYAVLVVKHGTGFSLWPTKAHGYNVSNTPWRNGKGDILADFIASCKKYGVKPGIYCSVDNNTFFGASDHMTDSARVVYNKMALTQLKEIWSQYGKLFEIWFDGGVLPTSKGGISEQVASLVKKYQPQAILFQGPPENKNLVRWVGNEYGDAPYPMWSRTTTTTSSDGIVEIKGLNGDPDGPIWCPGEADFPNRKKSAWEGGWFWRANRDQDILPASALVDKYYTTVGRNTNMIIGMAIDTSGRFPDKEAQVFAQFGNEIKRRFDKVIANTSGAGDKLILNLGNTPTSVNEVVLMENIAKGENVRKYSVEAWIDGNWKLICDGISVGHKRIQNFATVSTDKLRFTATEKTRQPELIKFAAYYVNAGIN